MCIDNYFIQFNFIFSLENLIKLYIKKNGHICINIDSKVALSNRMTVWHTGHARQENSVNNAIIHKNAPEISKFTVSCLSMKKFFFNVCFIYTSRTTKYSIVVTD